MLGGAPLPIRLTPAERDFYVELRRLVDAAGLSFRVLEESTSAARSDSGQSSFSANRNGAAG